MMLFLIESFVRMLCACRNSTIYQWTSILSGGHLDKTGKILIGLKPWLYFEQNKWYFYLGGGQMQTCIAKR